MSEESNQREELADRPFEEPHAGLENAIARIMADVLAVERVGRTDSFYDFGGTSLQAIRICARIEAELGYKSLPVWLYSADVLADFADRIQASALAGETRE